MAIRTLAIALACASLAACPAPGEGRNFELARAKAEPLVVAIEAYHADHQRYPRSLDALVPKYLAASAIDARYVYESTDPQDYRFAFKYGGPGINTCSRDSLNVAWECSGHY